MSFERRVCTEIPAEECLVSPFSLPQIFRSAAFSRSNICRVELLWTSCGHREISAARDVLERAMRARGELRGQLCHDSEISAGVKCGDSNMVTDDSQEEEGHCPLVFAVCLQMGCRATCLIEGVVLTGCGSTQKQGDVSVLEKCQCELYTPPSRKGQWSLVQRNLSFVLCKTWGWPVSGVVGSGN